MDASWRPPRVRIVTGKGGVGKTSVATALALAQARSGKRVLLAEVNGKDSVAALLGLAPVGFAMREIADNLQLVDMNPDDAIHEYALMVVRFEAVYRAVFANRLARSFVRLVPSLSELVLLGKVWFHERELDKSERPRFDVVVVDAPATGHAISMLRTPQAVMGTVPAGPLRDNARRIKELLSDHERTVLHIVTTPEEMPVNEAIELWKTATTELGMRVGTTFINQRVAALPASALAALPLLAQDPQLAGALRVLRMREDKREAGEGELQRLPATLREKAVSLPRLVGGAFAAKEVEMLAALLKGELDSE